MDCPNHLLLSMHISCSNEGRSYDFRMFVHTLNGRKITRLQKWNTTKKKLVNIENFRHFRIFEHED